MTHSSKHNSSTMVSWSGTLSTTNTLTFLSLAILVTGLHYTICYTILPKAFGNFSLYEPSNSSSTSECEIGERPETLYMCVAAWEIHFLLYIVLEFEQKSVSLLHISLKSSSSILKSGYFLKVKKGEISNSFKN